MSKAFIHALESRDAQGAVDLLSADIDYVFPIPPGAVETPGAIMLGKEEVASYVDSLLVSFSKLAWPSPEWTGSDDGRRAFMEAKGDLIVTHNGAPYHNTYLIRFDVHDGLITSVREYANSDLYGAQGIAPADVLIGAAERAAGGA